MPIRVIPICTVDKNLLGSVESLRAAIAFGLPIFASFNNFDFRADMIAISDIENNPFNNIRSNIINISIVIFYRNFRFQRIYI